MIASEEYCKTEFLKKNEKPSASIEENQRETQNLKYRADAAEKLVAKLEYDLESAIGGNIRTEGMSTLDVLRTSAEHDPNAEGGGITSPPVSQTTLIPILTSQRNRLHEKVSQMEEMLALEKTKQIAVQTEIEKVRQENAKLFEKVRFLQGGSNKSTNVVIEDDLLSDNYETPFKKFSATERNNRLQLHDRATLNIGRAILSSSKSRLTFFFYLLILHFLIMMVLYKYAYDQSTIRDQQTECEYQFNQHMLQSHKDH